MNMELSQGVEACVPEAIKAILKLADKHKV